MPLLFEETVQRCALTLVSVQSTAGLFSSSNEFLTKTDNPLLTRRTVCPDSMACAQIEVAIKAKVKRCLNSFIILTFCRKVSTFFDTKQRICADLFVICSAIGAFPQLFESFSAGTAEESWSGIAEIAYEQDENEECEEYVADART